MMQTVLHKYSSNGLDYLIFDIRKNGMALSSRGARQICAQNFGISSAAIVTGPIAAEGGLEEAVGESLEEAAIIPNADGRRRRRVGKGTTGVVVEGDPDMWVKLAKCCTPMPGDEILGFITRENGVSVHRRDCTNASNLLTHPERIVEVGWAPDVSSGYLVSVQVEALDRPGTLADITRAMADQQVNITSASVNVTKDHLARIKLTFESSDPVHLHHVMSTIRKVSGVYDAYRLKQ